MNYKMVWDDPGFITEADLGIAYRKMKADLFYESISPHRQDLCDYEKKLPENLCRLYTLLQSGQCKWMLKPDFIGGWTTIPKSIKPDADAATADGHCLHSDPVDQWRAAIAAHGANKQQATFRMTCRFSMDFHLIATLWILKVGHIYDARLGVEAYGSRLRRNHSDNPERPGAINTLSLGTFKPYLNYYKKASSDESVGNFRN